ncbi:bifunctional UDP-N-acetylglucosamine diphosphorylase/glucosamine-1-phosphate N-acetyltransferase GlmU [Hwanghaeella sp.]|uniref:bifunctional UDP-N-acetylglucosamine diphosphorylase/glucosamine-1-phosphate N-acetyltransferase GlmU n=1 Tax=Hwanghaeella sp. TaxID=2605943 RepID=UPI003CCB779C
MNSPSCATVVLSAGLGTRMRSAKPKAMHEVGGLPMVNHVLRAVAPMAPERTVVVVGPDMPDLERAVAPAETAVQHDRLGTADAVKAARAALSGYGDADATVFVVYGDSPFLKTATLQRMLDARGDGAAVVVLGFQSAEPTGYGRLIQDASGALTAIVEERDASLEQKAITFCNSGVMAIEAARLFTWIDRVTNDNAKGEYYLTDLVEIARADGCRCAAIEAPEAELQGVDSKVDLAAAEEQFQQARRHAALEDGVTLRDPSTVWFSYDTALAPGVEVGRNVVFGPGVTVEEGAVIKDFCHLEGAVVRRGADIGPFARLRPGTEIGAGARIGNFVEVKNAVFGEGAKANHLSYIGDAGVGAKANIGAGTITCNYDGYLKSRTEIGAGAFIGSNSALVAPVSIGAGAIVGAGSTVTQDVAKDAIAVARGQQMAKDGAAVKFREGRAAQKAKQQADKKAKA